MLWKASDSVATFTNYPTSLLSPLPLKVGADVEGATNEGESEPEEDQDDDEGAEEDGDESDENEGSDTDFARPAAARKGAPSTKPAAKPAAKTKSTLKKTGKAATSAAAARSRKKKPVANEDGYKDDAEMPENDVSLFEIVQNHGAAIDATVSDWIESYSEDREKAMVELVNFLIQSCGCPGTIDRDAFDDREITTETLEELQNQFDKNIHLDYPLIAKGPGKAAKAKKFRKNLGEFWTKWTVKSTHPILFTEADDWCMESLLVWLVAMSSSLFRPFRHTSTAVALAQHSALCDIAQKVQGEWTTANRQLAVEVKKRGGAAGGRERGEREVKIQESVGVLHSRKMKLEHHMNDLFETVFVHRYRDSDPTIRMECIRELGVWISKFPTTYLDSQYLRYIGWMLSDKIASNDTMPCLHKDASVRLEALRGLSRLYANESMLSGLRQFTERFRERLIEMAGRESDPAVRAEAISTVVNVAAAGLLEDGDSDKILPLVFEADPRVRKLIAGLAADVFNEEYVEPKKEEARARGIGNMSADTDGRWIDVHCLVEMLVKLLRTLEARDAGGAADPTAGEASSQQPKTSQSQSESQSQSLRPQSQSQSQSYGVSMDSDDEDEYDETDEQRDARRWDARERDEVARWTCRNEREGAADGSAAALGFPRVAAAVVTLWDSIDIIKDWKTMCSYLSADLTSSAPAESASQLLAADYRDDSADFYRLLEDEETCLVHVLHHVLAHTISEAEGASSKKSGSTTVASSDARLEISRALVTILPRLLQKYAGEFEGAGVGRLVEIVMLVRLIDIGVYLELRMLKAYDALFEDLKRIFMTHSNPGVLAECAQTLRFLLGSAEKPKPSASTAPTAIPARRRAPRGKAASGPVATGADDADASSNSVNLSTLQKVEDLGEEIASTQIAGLLGELKTIVENDESPSSETPIIETLTSLRNAVRRLAHLWNVLDLGELLASGLGGGDEESEWDSLFELQNKIMEAALTAVTKKIAEPEDAEEEPEEDSEVARSPAPLSEAAAVLDDIIETVLYIMNLDVTWELRKVFFAAAGPAALVPADADAAPPPPLNPSDPAAPPLTPFQTKCDRVIVIAEAIVTNPAPLRFGLGVRLAATKVLTYIFQIVNSDCSKVLPPIARTLDVNIQARATECVARAVELMGVPRRHRRNPQAPGPTVLHPLQAESGRMALLRLVADLSKLAVVPSAGIADPSAMALLARYYNFHPDEPTLSASATLPAQGSPMVDALRPDLDLFGLVWDGIADTFIRRVVWDRVHAAIDAVAEDEGVQELETALGDAAECVFEGLKQSMDLAYTLPNPTLVPTLALAKAIIALIKQWSPSAQKHDDAHAPVTDALLALLRRGADDMVLRTVDAAISGSDTSAGWRVWGAVGGAVRQAIELVGQAKEAEGVEEIGEGISQTLATQGIKPVEGDRKWDGYWAFVKALEKGDSTIKRNTKKGAVRKEISRGKRHCWA
ncbi:hypothetical protein BDK51DRAFT_37291 [Blyttiomyces helicus]|uniref:SCD domain-containing protein n=1 Tax=Blyttiomyces helicus TaxID=388810 RepID=A0A4V1ISG3_9FUNG|nr:hypothetical protein BDK51DRAFT_37291 [Blyttiomyces helicus]|eukprot:RKO93457.1 hypothetical protein BDK51DRAFT_37291 [Blyttiomyces helicus]